ncbi:MAG: DegV family protein [Actinobacteria bacterium]|nr:MAG: DegV family protein [Actinomycetota bacterium]
MGKVGIVCDSTADRPLEWYAERDVSMVPLKVSFGEETFLDWREMAPDEFFPRLKAFAGLPKTSQPSPADFTAAYEALAAAGAEEIVSIHLTSPLSGTVQSATLAAETAPVPVRVVDTKLVSQAVALVVLAAVEARDAGGDGAAVEAAALRTAASTRLFFVLDTLDYLVKGGRAGKAQGLAASLLDIKPILTFNAEGTIEPFKKVKGRRKAFQELAAHVAEETQTAGRARLALLHSVSPETVADLRGALEASGADYELESVGLVGAVIGTYAGPDAVGVAYHPLA